MLTRRERKKFHVLEIIQNSEVPVGASHISIGLEKLGINISEATAGRFLLELDKEGLTKKNGFRGRVLTEMGEHELKQMQMQHDRMEYGEQFFRILDGKTEKELVDVLIARRAIERELARLAAINLTPEIKREMERSINNQKLSGENYNEQDALFHGLIAKAAGNKILATIINIIRQDVELAPALEYIRKKVNGSIVVDHITIMEAIINKDPEAAEKAMVNHIENLIRDVNLFWTNK